MFLARAFIFLGTSLLLFSQRCFLEMTSTLPGTEMRQAFMHFSLDIFALCIFVLTIPLFFLAFYDLFVYRLLVSSIISPNEEMRKQILHIIKILFPVVSYGWVCLCRYFAGHIAEFRRMSVLFVTLVLMYWHP